jgi:hypothetical protein
MSIFVFIPTVLRRSSHPFVWAFLLVANLLCYFMWLWCWLIVITRDPGSIADDLCRRGVLSRVLQGDIPRCLRHLRLCATCHVPMPFHSCHCDECDCCYLRPDHHCAVTGQCVADKNFKSFVLSFFWGGLLGFLMFPASFAASIADTNALARALALAASFSWIVIGGLLWIAGFVFAGENFRKTAAFRQIAGIGKTIGAAKFLQTFGKTWWQRLLPTQDAPTSLAWPGVDWADQDGSVL